MSAYKCIFRCILTALVIARSQEALAYDWSVEANVIRVEGSYMPNVLPFIISKDAGNCPGNTLIYWEGPVDFGADAQANKKAVYALLLTAIATGRPVALFGINAGCKVQFIHLK